jgi:hypothetical protein
MHSPGIAARQGNKMQTTKPLENHGMNPTLTFWECLQSAILGLEKAASVIW